MPEETGSSFLARTRDLLVNAWYTGGVNVIDFTQPTRLKEVAFYDRVAPGGTWSAYPYTGPLFKTGAGIPVYASDGVTSNGLAEGMVAYRAILPKPGKAQIERIFALAKDFDVDVDIHLDGGYTVFGRVIVGMEVVDNIIRGDKIRSIVIK